MNGLEKDGYAFLPGFITPEQAEHLNQEFMFALSVVPQAFGVDNQVASAKSIYNFIPFMELLVGKCNDLSGLVGQNLLPTYTYSRMYFNGAVLEKHTDRSACEISVTLNLAGDKEWPIYFETPDGQEHKINMTPGDAALYLGCERPHWRDVFDGAYTTQVFLHYVRSRGMHNDHAFDRQNAGLNHGA